MDADITGSDLDFDEAIEEEYSRSEEFSEGEEIGPKHENPRIVQFQRREDTELKAVV